MVESSLTTKSAVAPSSFDFSTSKNQFQVDNQVGQILFMKDLPADLGDDLISVLSDLIRKPRTALFAIILMLKPF